jgi:hypothetical protein
MNVIEVTKPEEKQFKFGNIIKTKAVYHINRKDHKEMSSVLVRDTYDWFEKEAGSPNNIMVRVLNSTGIMTLKGFNANELNFIDYDEYFVNRVHSEINFDKFYSMEITVLK